MPRKLPNAMEEEQMKMKTWRILLIISLEEIELPNQDLVDYI